MIKRFVNSLIPPIIKQALTNFQTRTQKKPQPEWVTLNKGPLMGFKIFIDPGSNLGKVMLDNYDDFIYRNLPEASHASNLVFYDIGAHFGFHTLGFSALAGDNGKVYSFEPHPLNRERLNKNIAENKRSPSNIVVIDKAITDRKGDVLFEMITDLESGWSSSSRVLENEGDAVETAVKKHIQVRTDTIDNLILDAEILKPDVIKIDVEGEEFKVLCGARSTISQYKPILFIEIHTMECMFLVQKFLVELGYLVDLIHKEADGRCFIMAKASKP